MPERLKNLRITRVAVVAEGDNPHAEVVMWKSRRDRMQDALEHRRATKTEHEPRGGTTMSDTMTKASDVTSRLVKLVDQEITRRPTDERGHRVTRQMALAKIWTDPEVKKALHELEETGVDGTNALHKALR